MENTVEVELSVSSNWDTFEEVSIDLRIFSRIEGKTIDKLFKFFSRIEEVKYIIIL
ncbi:hypothetical protein LEP1GSC021_2814 [Leptospira noguchii str. 1993005606]|uniref:Uncharacterized protein n=1 Tax=Leptospira noguchii str. 2007001578 TaxID=1049974 RepID=A0ABN0IVW0_9LEPT|nr:hypothetical protein LEP1GSC035_1292 [Leptospira noguchii str. 2007001578]EPE85035.1 hypothetical protein LEP1GSC021_2814 [Leptospira noguchii str. 1993005606]